MLNLCGDQIPDPDPCLSVCFLLIGIYDGRDFLQSILFEDVGKSTVDSVIQYREE